MHYTSILRVPGEYPGGYQSDEDREREYNLTGEEVDLILDYMIHFQKTYFPNIPLKDELDKDFVFNIPRSMIDAIIRAHQENTPDILNPAIAMFPLFTDVPFESFGSYLMKIADICFEDSASDRFIVDSSKKWAATNPLPEKELDTPDADELTPDEPDEEETDEDE